jgi:cyclopropane fatty-acyl-phospholipid synthase-like methyltransferase
VKLIEELRRPERWGMSADHALVKGLSAAVNTAALVAGRVDESPALYLAANGCKVTALDEEPDAVDRVMTAALRAGLTDRLDARVGGLESWVPQSPLFAVVLGGAAFAHLDADERRDVMERLKRITVDGGVHLLQNLGDDGPESLAELRSAYRGWTVDIDSQSAQLTGFLAQKRS